MDGISRQIQRGRGSGRETETPSVFGQHPCVPPAPRGCCVSTNRSLRARSSCFLVCDCCVHTHTRWKTPRRARERTAAMAFLADVWVEGTHGRRKQRIMVITVIKRRPLRTRPGSSWKIRSFCRCPRKPCLFQRDVGSPVPWPAIGYAFRSRICAARRISSRSTADQGVTVL